MPNTTNMPPVGSKEFQQRKEAESNAMQALLDQFISIELSDAVDLVMLGSANAQDQQPGYGFACFAARLLAEMGASNIRGIAAQHSMDVIRLSASRTFWARFPRQELSEEELSAVLSAEAVMNRLLFVKEAFDAQQGAAIWTEADCSLADVGLIESVANLAPNYAKGATANPLIELYGTEGRRGGEWDLRTRFAIALEALRLPYRLEYLFDCNAAEGVFSIDYTVPQPAWMPQYCFNAQQGIWEDVSDQAPLYAMRYTLALGALLAAIAFGTGVGVQQVRIASHPGSLNAPAAQCLYVQRLPFMYEVLPQIEARNTAWIQNMLNAAQEEDEFFAAAISLNHKEVALDTRELPQELQGPLFAKTVSELDILSPMEADDWDAVNAAEADRQDSPLAAIAVLESVVDEAERAVKNLPPGTEALYCSDVPSRCLLALNQPAASTQFVRYSDSGFRARSILCDLYGELNEQELAVQQASKCIELAPTSPIGYTDMVNTLFSQNNYEAALPYLKQAIAVATQEPTIAFIYYRMAFALWQTGSLEPALASYVLANFHHFARSEAVQQEMQELLEIMGNPEIPSISQARETLQRFDIMPAPSLKVRKAIASTLIPLVDSGILDFCAPLARMMGASIDYRDELFSVSNSLAG